MNPDVVANLSAFLATVSYDDLARLIGYADLEMLIAAAGEASTLEQRLSVAPLADAEKDAVRAIVLGGRIPR